MRSNWWGLMESEWHQVSSGLQDFSKYYCRFLQCWDLNSLDSSSDLQFRQSFFQALMDRSKNSNNNLYYRHFYFPQAFLFLARFIVHFYLHFCIVVSLKFFFSFSKWYQIFLSNANNLHTVVWFQEFLSNTNYFIVPVIIS